MFSIVNGKTTQALISVVVPPVKGVLINGGFIQIGNIVIVDLTFIGEMTTDNTPVIAYGFPATINPSALSAVAFTGEHGNIIETAQAVMATDGTLLVSATTHDKTYHVTGAYLTNS